jgi:mono/diheme cytochrome c family protein
VRAFQATLAGVGLLVALSYSTLQAQAPKAAAPAAPAAASKEVIERGRYIVEIGGCNDCHTAGYATADGVAPEANRLKGDILGFSGAWGTTYPTNLRLSLGKMTEENWVKYAKALKTKPPMPWFNVRAMTEADLRGVYQYIKQLPGAAGTAAPTALAPGTAPKPPFVQYPK